MKKFNSIAIAGFAAAIILGGCSSKEVTPKKAEPTVLIEKHESLPAWVNSEDSDLLSAVGSARYKNQTYMQQKAEAQLSASGELAAKIEKRINTLMKSYHQSTGQSDATLEDVFKQTSSSIASQTISGLVVKDVFVAKDGEMFVRVIVNPKYLEASMSGSLQSNKIAWQQVQAKKAFIELEKEAKEYRDERNAIPSTANVDDTNVSSKG